MSLMFESVYEHLLNKGCDLGNLITVNSNMN
jgi:hypothetical protein